jgi:uncharacterized protein (UPF0335 family)
MTGKKTNTGMDDGLLKSLVERIERLEEEKKALADDIKEVYAEVAGAGFDKKMVRRAIKVRKMDQAKIAADNEIFDLYMAALGF